MLSGYNKSSGKTNVKAARCLLGKTYMILPQRTMSLPITVKETLDKLVTVTGGQRAALMMEPKAPPPKLSAT